MLVIIKYNYVVHISSVCRVRILLVALWAQALHNLSISHGYFLKDGLHTWLMCVCASGHHPCGEGDRAEREGRGEYNY